MKFSENIIYQQERNPFHPAGTFPGIMMIAVNDYVLKGASMHFGSAWWTAPLPESETYKPHYHDADEIIGLFGSNIEDPFDLGGEAEYWFEDEKYTITKSCLIYVPKGTRHCPLFYRRVDRPWFTFSVVNAPTIYENPVDNPKWRHLKDAPQSPPA